jgi:hypothetical protein
MNTNSKLESATIFEFFGTFSGEIKFEAFTLNTCVLSDNNGAGVFFDIGGKKGSVVFDNFNIETSTLGY